MGKFVWNIIRVFCLYWICCFTLGILGTLLSIGALTQSKYRLSRYSSLVARGAIFPYVKLSERLDSTFFIIWDKSLILLEEVPQFAAKVKALQKTYTDKTPLDPQLVTDIDQEYSTFLYKWAALQQLISESELIQRILSYSKYDTHYTDQLSANSDILQATDLFLSFVSRRLNEGKPVRLLILFQNNMELRATGGFPGSYAILHLAKGEPIQLEVEDIYVPDGQLKEHVDPPLPIQEAFQQGFWKLRDANWHPDFPESAQRVQWFFTKAGYPEVDGVIGLTFSPVEDMLKITGPVKVPDLNTEVTAENMYPILQRADDKEFFPGSTKKKDTLSAFATQLIYHMQHLHPQQYLDVLTLVSNSLQQKNIQVYLDDPDLNAVATLNHWDAKLIPVTCSNGKCDQDYFSLFEANLGVNKSNCCVNRSISLSKTKDEKNLVSTTTSIHYENVGPGTQYVNVAGDYKAFVRFYFPLNTQVSPPMIDGKIYSEYIQQMKTEGYLHPITSLGYSLGEINGLQEVGFWIVVPNGKSLKLELKTKTSLPEGKNYSLYVQKQPGTRENYNNLTIEMNNQYLFFDTLKADSTFIYKD